MWLLMKLEMLTIKYPCPSFVIQRLRLTAHVFLKTSYRLHLLQIRQLKLESSHPDHQCYEIRKRSEIRTELIDKIRDLLDGYVHGDSLALSCARYCPVQKMVEYLKEKETSEHQINCFAP